ncbi:MAG: N-acyl-D-amino-acid deacylase family protein [Aminivibrio sp.]|jgi:N-acyl-D-amino-acid deacylase
MPKEFDLVIKNAKVYDGTGGPWYFADIAVRDGVIAGTGKFDVSRGKQIIDAEGRAVAPGFVDPHTHSDLNSATVPDADAKIVQGVTTEVTGNCGLSLTPVSRDRLNLLRDYLKPFIPREAMPDFKWTRAGELMDIVDKTGFATDIAFLSGHGTVRLAVMGFDDREPTAAELEKMKELFTMEMEDGCVGFSTGLIYPPGCFSTPPEIIELCKIAAQYDGVYATHMRGESGEILKSVEEALTAAETGGCRLQISHHKIIQDYEGLSADTLRMMEEARERGVDVACDVYPYIAGSSLISVVLPPWAREGGVEKMLARLEDASDRERIKKDFLGEIPGWDNFIKGATYKNILISSSTADKSLEGKTIQQVADERGIDASDAILDIMLSERGEVTIVIISQSDSDNRRIMAHELAMIGSDSLATAHTGKLAYGKPHPRCFGTFPRVLGYFSRDQKLFSLEKAVWKISGFPAQRFGLADRGLIKSGLIADFVVFDPATISGTDDFVNPRQIPTGIRYVVKNGKVVVDNGHFLGKTLGKSIRKFGHKAD